MTFFAQRVSARTVNAPSLNGAHTLSLKPSGVRHVSTTLLLGAVLLLSVGCSDDASDMNGAGGNGGATSASDSGDGSGDGTGRDDEDGNSTGTAGASGTATFEAAVWFAAPCSSDGDCRSEDDGEDDGVCFPYPSKGDRCTLECSGDADCPISSLCNPKGVCKVD